MTILGIIVFRKSLTQMNKFLVEYATVAMEWNYTLFSYELAEQIFIFIFDEYSEGDQCYIDFKFAVF